MNESDVQTIGYDNVDRIDDEVPDGALVLNMVDADEKEDTFFEQDEQVCGFDEENGFAIWNVTESGTYWVFCQMTAEEARPLCLSVNDVLISNDICNGVTGTWENDGLAWFHFGPFDLEGSLKVHTEEYWPHVKRFVLLPAATGGSPVPARELEYSSDGFSIVETIDDEVPDGVLVLNMVDADEKEESFFEQDEQVCGFDEENGFAAWSLPESGSYFVFCQMTAEEARPLSLSINDEIVSDSICEGVTGSWESDDLKWFKYGPFELEGSLKVHTEEYWPHVKRFVLVPTSVSASVPNNANRMPENLDASCMVVLRKPTGKSDNVEVEDTMIIVEGDEGGFFEFEFINEVFAQQVFLDIVYASGDSRPVMLSVNGETVEEECCADETGGYGEEEFSTVRCGPFAIQPEVNTIKVALEEGYFPHIGEIRVVNANEDN